MDVFEAVRTVLAIREYNPQSLPDEVIRKIVDAGRLTASSMNGQPWQFVVVEGRESLQKLGEMAKTGPYIADAGAAVAVAVERTKYAESDASRAIQSMVLTAWEEGIGSNWVGFYGLEKAREYLGIPDELELLAIIPFGYSDAVSYEGKKDRKPFSEVVHKGRYGQHF
ncbi:MAG: nitroreductase family protein [Anaerolineales bacterium]